ncbi:MAG: glutamate-5-semialdehyde dehydrogenase [Trueperaceae bacterium]
MTAIQTFNLNDCLHKARKASRKLANADRDAALLAIAEGLEQHQAEIIAANAKDVAGEKQKGTKESLIDRLTLTEKRIKDITDAVRQIVKLPDPLHKVLEAWQCPNGLNVQKVSVPFGVIGMIYESRPNVTVDAATLCLKAGSAAVLRGSANALHSNRVLVCVMREAIKKLGLPEDAIQLIDSPERELVTELLSARGKVDLVIPRGGTSLIQHVVQTAKVPTIETGIGNCHIFVDASADLDKAKAIILNAKVQRPGVCNSAETLLVHKDIAVQFIADALGALAEHNVELFADEGARALYPAAKVAMEHDWEMEYLDYKLAVKVVASLDEAIDHITTYGTQHSEAIVTQDMNNAKRFQMEIDAATVYVNASTRFTDGFEFGFGAEIGISTQKLHARGPMGLEQIVTYKYLIEGNGQIRG